MDNVVCQTGMRRLLREQFLENCSRLELVCVGRVAEIRCNRERQCIEDLRFVVVRIFCRNLSHGIAIGEPSRLLRRTSEVPVQIAYGREIGAFAACLCAPPFAAFSVLAAKLQ
jgi:hypothetical protein